MAQSLLGTTLVEMKKTISANKTEYCREYCWPPGLDRWSPLLRRGGGRLWETNLFSVL